MSSLLLFPAAAAATDALTFAGRAARIGDGAVRLRADGGTLLMSAAVLTAQSLLEETPMVLALRALPVDPELVCDLVVDAATLAEAPGTPLALVLPETGVSPAWAGISPPRTGWTGTGTIAASVLASRAQWGIAAVAEAMPESPGEEIVQAVRSRVWGAADDALHGLPLGAAFAAFALGFIVGDEAAQLRTAGVWTRLTLRRGHVLVRTTTRVGLTPVRATGRPDA